MSRMKLVDTVQLEQGLASVADAIREVTDSEEKLAFPDDFAAAIRTLTGGTTEGNNLLDSLILGEITGYSSDVEGTLIDSAFRAMAKLVSISLPNITSAEANGFYGCTSLTEVYMPKLGRVSAYLFYRCTALQRLVLPESTIFGPQACVGCTSLEYVDLGSATTVYLNSFKDCPALTTLILRNTSGCKGGTADAFQNSAIGEGQGYIYVPASTMEYYKTAQYWSDFASQYRAIEDYPEICGTAQETEQNVTE